MYLLVITSNRTNTNETTKMSCEVINKYFIYFELKCQENNNLTSQVCNNTFKVR